MPFTSGTISATWYRVDRDFPKDAREQFDITLKRYAFTPIDSSKGEVESMGWVDSRDILNPKLLWDLVTLGKYAFLGLRFDRKTVSATLLKAHIREELRRVAREKKARQISRTERKIIMEQVKATLLRKASPSVAVYEASWNTETGDVLFGSSSKSANERFCEQFAMTFDIELFPHHPLARVDDIAEEEGLGMQLDKVQPSFWGSGRRVAAVHPAAEGDV